MSHLLASEYKQAIIAIKDWFPKDSRISIALDGWTAINKLALLSVIAYHIDINWNLVETQIGFKQVNDNLYP